MSTSIEDNELPKAILTRIMKHVLPENTNIQANAKLAMTKSTTLFINYLASAANDVAASAGHKIVSGAHVLKAIESLDLEEMLPRLNEEFQAFQAIQRSRKEGAAKSSKDKDDSPSSAASKKRKPTADGSNLTAKSRKSSTTANPGDGRDASTTDAVDDEEAGEEENEDADEKEDQNDDENEDEGEEDPDATDNGAASLNMDEKEKDDDEKAPNLDEEDDDSDGF
ncbi:hypothetical protein BGX21_001950 [Mortierella sp. AD011]|nr:hypothetical protein BGX20_004302 [Mortierella sp. AD010]KAF9401355.1 hypothetical protein BGX21_001950 [Mortierella sp. AD011]